MQGLMPTQKIRLFGKNTIEVFFIILFKIKWHYQLFDNNNNEHHQLGNQCEWILYMHNIYTIYLNNIPIIPCNKINSKER